MEASIISALAALTGATVGGLTSGVTNWLTHRSQLRAQWLHHERSRRQILYRDFIARLQTRAFALRRCFGVILE